MDVKMLSGHYFSLLEQLGTSESKNSHSFTTLGYQTKFTGHSSPRSNGYRAVCCRRLNGGHRDFVIDTPPTRKVSVLGQLRVPELCFSALKKKKKKKTVVSCITVTRGQNDNF